MEDRVAALGAQADPQAVVATRVDSHGHVAPVVGEDFHNALVYKDAQLQKFAVAQFEVGGFGGARQHARQQRGAAGVDDQDVVKGLGALGFDGPFCK